MLLFVSILLSNVLLFMLPQELQTSQLGKCSEFQAFPGHGLKCCVTGVSQFVIGHDKSGDTSITVKLLGEGLQSKDSLVGVADSTVQQYQVVLGNRKWLGLNGYELSNEVNQIIISNEASGQTVILVGINGKMCIVIFIFCGLAKNFNSY